MSADGSIILSAGELAVLATQLIADRLADPGEWAAYWPGAWVNSPGPFGEAS